MDQIMCFERSDGIVYHNQYHIIFCPKYGRKVLVDEVKTDLIQILNNIAKEKKIKINALAIEENYVYINASFDPRLSVHKLIVGIKNTSSGLLRSMHPALKTRIPSLWSREYIVCTDGELQQDNINEWISKMIAMQTRKGSVSNG